MSVSTKSVTSSQIARRLKISRQTAWLFMHKVRLAMKNSEAYPLDGQAYVDEFVFGVKKI